MGKNKAPAFQFYYKDFMGDAPLAFAPSSVKGIWISLLCMMWDVDKPLGALQLERGKISGFNRDFPRALRCEKEDWSLFILYAEAYGFCEIECNENVTGDKIVTIINRRMYREEKDRKNHGLRQRQYRARQKSDEKVTSPSASAPAKKLLNVPFKMPEKEEIDNSSFPKIREDIEKTCKELYDNKIFPDVHKWVNTMFKRKKSNRAILHTLGRCYLHGKFENDKNAWAYCTKIIGVEDGNYNELEYTKTD